jgi:hypothetical protein
VLRELGYDNVSVRVGDGYLGWPECGPFDAMIVTAALNHVPPPLMGMPQFLLKSVKQALPLIMLCGVSLRFNVLDGALLGSVSDKRGP